MKIGTIQEAIENAKNKTHDFTVNGKCSNCGQCCSNILWLTDLEIKRIKNYVSSHNIKPTNYFLPSAQPIVNLVCPFRNNAGKKCNIYSVRPQICRDYQCDKFINGERSNIDFKKSKIKVVFMRETFFAEE